MSGKNDLKNTVWLCVLITTFAFAGPVSDSLTERDRTLAKDIAEAQLQREEKLTDYTATERYTIRNTHFSDPAGMTVAVTYRAGVGKSYQILSRYGPSMLQSGVLDRLIKEETEMSRGEARKASLVTEENYRIQWFKEQMLDGRLCDVVNLEPRTKSPHLLRGQAWVDLASHHLVRIEGKPTASPSFWAGTPTVIRDYVEIGSFAFAKASRAVSQTFLLGKTELNIEYSDYKVNLREEKRL